MKTVVVLFGLEVEAHFLLERIHGYRIVDLECDVYEGRLEDLNVRVAISGPGAERAFSAAGRVLSHGDADAFIVAGFAGALDPGLKCGDLVIADSVGTLDSGQVVTRPCDPGLIALTSWVSGGRTCRTVRGSLLSVDEAISIPSEKRSLFHVHGCKAVDTESGAAGTCAGTLDLPWVAVRSVVDAASDELPAEFGGIVLADGALSRRAAISAGLRHPWAFGKCFRASRLANAHLFAFLETYLLRLCRARA